LLAETAARFPDRPAVVFRDRADHARTLRKDAAGAILYAAEKATEMAVEAIQTLSGNGYVNEYLTGRLWRDAKLYEIGAGTSEIRRMLIGRDVQP
jgi:isovaleryl-CoA dehydrogenase